MSHADSNMLGRRRNVGVVPIDEPLTPAQVEQQAGFYRAIQADLDDDAPRLVYADWLDEQGGDGRALRAEFIRLQCAAPFRSLHGVTGPPSAASDRIREEAIFELCGEGWDKELNLELQRFADVYEPPWAPVWRRGFPEKMLFQSITNRTHDPTANGLPFLRDAGCRFPMKSWH